MDRIDKRIAAQEKARRLVETAQKYKDEQPKDLSPAQLINKINNCKNRNNLNELRLLVVDAQDSEILKLWQKKYKQMA